ncbi:protein CHROMATIN REMODELING 5-like [Lycium ferocissimum]|uniref:protein CHROMATIN REMODELING 5-like n=1 Tax=Lycium ferocissimum TaxID=112874 RepID=UPI0028163CA8|nr:protein CHROMATIN REMODELING 5-like [Lycium ferocissimum]
MGLKATDKQNESLRSTATSLGKGKQSKLSSSGLNVKMGRGRAARGQKVEQLVKGEGEMSDNDEVYEQFKEVKWMKWCEYVMMDEEKTLKRLQRLQTTTADLPKDKVLAKIRNYLQLLDRRIDQVVLDYEKEPHKQEIYECGNGTMLSLLISLRLNTSS